MSEKKRTETIRPAAAAVLLLLLSILALGCSKKTEECAAVQPIAASVRPQLDIDVKDDKSGAKSAEQLGGLIDAATSAQATLDKTVATDKDVRGRVATYSRTLRDLTAKATVLKVTLVEQSKAADGVAARAAADTEVKRTRKEFFGSCNVADLEMFAARTAGYERSNPPMLAEMADATEKMKFSNEKATAAASGYAKALRDKGTVLKNGKDLDAQLKDLVEKSATTRGAFTDARTAVQAADAALETTCTSVK